MALGFKSLLSATTGLIVTTGAMWAAPAVAQEETFESDLLENIVVQARRRDEDLLEVPVSITALTAADLRSANAFGLEDLAQLTPGLNFSAQAGGFAEPTIRGLSQTDISGIIGNVGVFIDGIYINNRSALEFGNMDIAQIEVLKGPQSALFGRDTFAGAINYRTSGAILGEFTGMAEGQIGSDNLLSARASINVPIGDYFAVRVFGGLSSFDGTIPNTREGATENVGGWDERSSFGAQALFEKGRVSLKLFTLTNNVDEDNPATRNIFFTENTGGTQYTVDQNGDPISLFTLPAGTQPNINSVSLDPRGTGVQGTYRLHYGILDVDAEIANITLTISKSRSEYENNFDNFGDPANFTRPFFGIYTNYFFTNSAGDISEQESYELRVSSKEDSPFDWQFGYVHFDSTSGVVLSTTTPLLADISVLETITRVEERIVQGIDAVFGAVNIPVTDKFNIAAEGRYTWENQQLTDEAQIFFFPAVSRPFSISPVEEFKYWSGRISADYTFNDEFMIYGSVARGVKTGGINAAEPVDSPFRTFAPETNLAFEIGAKGLLLDGRLLVNAALFYIDWNDLQATAPADLAAGAAGPVVSNGIGQPTSKGIELDATFDVTDAFQVRMATTWLDPTFGDEFIDQSIASACPTGFDPTRLGQTCSTTVSGTRLPRTPNFTMFLSGTYTWEDLFKGFDGYLRADFSHEGNKFLTSQNISDIDSINLVNFRGGFRKENTEIAIWIDNAFNEDLLVRALPITDGASRSVCSDCGGVRSTRVIAGNGRTFGLTVTQRF